MAAYPATLPSFTTKSNVTDVVDAAHPNSVQDEVVAIATELGLVPRNSVVRGINYASVKARLEGIETDYRTLANHDSHGALAGLTGDDHAQYLRTDGTRAPTGVGGMTAVPVAVTVGAANALGTGPTLARSDHVHAVADGAPAASAVGDTAANGAAATFARSDHRHAREAFAAVTAATTYGVAAATGTAPTVAHSDHTHGTPALTAVAPTTAAAADAAAVGTGTAPAREDHRHGMPAFGAVTAETTFGIAPANGAAATLARSDHTHGTPALATTVTDERAWGITPTAGTAGTAARGDHTHGSPDATLQGPTGMVAMWPTATPPGGWLLCNGQAISRTTYATLFSVIGTTWGVGDNSTTFNVPDIRGRVVVGSMGAGSGLTSRALAATGGEEAHVLSVAELASHSHTVNSHNHGGASGASDPNHNHSITYENVTTSFMAANWDHTHGYDRPGMLNIGLSPGSNQYALNRLGDQTASANIDHQHSANHGHSAGSTSINHTHTIGGDSPGTNAQGSGTAHNVMQPWVAMPFVIKT